MDFTMVHSKGILGGNYTCNASPLPLETRPVSEDRRGTPLVPRRADYGQTGQ